MNHTMNALSALLQRNEGEAKTDDYTGEDGLLHCGKCHAPRQMHAPDYIRKTTGESVVWIPCDCEANERATLRQQREQERFFAGCIANALMEQGTAVCMTNFSRIVNDLNGRGNNRNDVIDRLCSYPLLIIDDFGIERETDYTLEQIYNIVDSRYRNQRPLIVTGSCAENGENASNDAAGKEVIL